MQERDLIMYLITVNKRRHDSQLLNDEKVLERDVFLSNTFIITNKRLILETQNNQNNFVNLNTLAKVDVIKKTVVVEKMTSKQVNSYTGLFSFLFLIGFGIYMAIATNSYNFESGFNSAIMGILIAVFTFFIPAIIVFFIIFSVYRKVTLTTKEQVGLIITSINGNNVFTCNYDLHFLQKLEDFQYSLNNIIFSKV